MKKLIFTIVILFSLSTALVGCREDKSTSEKVEDSIEEVGEELEEGAEEIEDEIDD